jgi:hypothetical protein
MKLRNVLLILIVLVYLMTTVSAQECTDIECLDPGMPQDCDPGSYPSEYSCMEGYCLACPAGTYQPHHICAIEDVSGSQFCLPCPGSETVGATECPTSTCITLEACVTGADWVTVEEGQLSLIQKPCTGDPETDGDCGIPIGACGGVYEDAILVEGVSHAISLNDIPGGDDPYLIEGAASLPVGIESLEGYRRWDGGIRIGDHIRPAHPPPRSSPRSVGGYLRAQTLRAVGLCSHPRDLRRWCG